MGEPLNGAELAFEAVQPIGFPVPEQLERDPPAIAQILRFVDHPESALSEATVKQEAFPEHVRARLFHVRRSGHRAQHAVKPLAVVPRQASSGSRPASRARSRISSLTNWKRLRSLALACVSARSESA